MTRRLFCGAAASAATMTSHAASILLSAEPINNYLLVRGDDMGAARSINAACVEACQKGICRSVEVLVPGPWFMDAVKLLKDAPEIDVGVHLCLTSEWDRVKWRPLTNAPSLVDSNGYFHPRTFASKDAPLGSTGFLNARPKLEEVERELRAQINLLLKHIPRATHLSAHMGAATATQELIAITQNLAKEFKLRMEFDGFKSNGTLENIRGVGTSKQSAEEKEAALLALIHKSKTEGNLWLLVTHPAYDDAETRAMGHPGYENVASDRDGITKMLTSPRVLEATKSFISIISYADLNRS
ncbi:MAG: ChbG/HpnK family deacetylase [Pirellulaceae bacterium]